MNKEQSEHSNRYKMYTKEVQYLPAVDKCYNNYIYRDYWQNNNSNQIYVTP